MEAAGILPGARSGDASDYIQPFELQAVAFDTAHLRFEVSGLAPARLGRDWLAFPEHAPTVMLDSADVVYAGYGISVQGQEHNDYEGIDVSGKVVIARSGAPDGLDSVRTFGGTFAPDDFLLKWVSAAQRGAAAIVVLEHPEALAQWEDYSTLASGRAMSLAGDEDYVPVMPYLFLSEAFGEQVLSSLGVPAESVAGGSAGLAPVEAKQPLTLHLLPRRERAASGNVVGYLPGAADADSFVAVGAHYDHLGTRNGDVFNGADDNASGVVAALAAARALADDARAGAPPERSVVFVFHSAEEKGLLGARHFTEQPEESVVQSMEHVVAHVNLDMVGREHPDSLYVVGASRMSSALGELVNETNRALGEGRPLFVLDRVFDDPDDPERIYQRSDHFRYAIHGVPVVFFSDGMGANWRKDTPADDYHRVTDDPEKIHIDKLERVSRLVYELVHRAAQSERVFPIDGEIPVDD